MSFTQRNYTYWPHRRAFVMVAKSHHFTLSKICLGNGYPFWRVNHAILCQICLRHGIQCAHLSRAICVIFGFSDDLLDFRKLRNFYLRRISSILSYKIKLAFIEVSIHKAIKSAFDSCFSRFGCR